MLKRANEEEAERIEHQEHGPCGCAYVVCTGVNCGCRRPGCKRCQHARNRLFKDEG